MKNSFEYILKKNEEHQIEVKNTFSTGFNNLDELITGIQPKDFIVVAARPGVGKTKFLINLTFNIAKQCNISFISFEDDNYVINKRFIKTKNVFLLDSDKQLLNNISIYSAKDFDYKLSIFFESLRKQIKVKDIKVFIIDGLQFMIPRKTYCFIESNNSEALDYKMEIKYVVHSLAQFAKENNISIIVSTNINREIEVRGGDQKPRNLHYLGDNEIELEANKVIFMYNPSYIGFTVDEYGNSTINQVELLIRKNKNKKLGSIFLQEIPDNYQRFYEVKFANGFKSYQDNDLSFLDEISKNKKDNSNFD